MTRSSWIRLLLACCTLLISVLTTSLIVRYWPRPPLNAILITLGATRADHLGCYGYEFAMTPALDELAKQGAMFERAYSSVPMTLPAHCTIFTSLYPPEHGVHVDGKKRLPDDVPLMTELLKKHNYTTGAFLFSLKLHSGFGLDRGFDLYDDSIVESEGISGKSAKRRDGHFVMNSALEWLNANRAKPFFCWIHLDDACDPYDPRREDFGEQFVQRPYDAGIAFSDQQIGRLTSFLKKHHLTERTLIVVAGDHGEGLGDHGEQFHGTELFNSTLRVPMIVAGPQFIQRGARVGVAVSHVDIEPTILSLLGIGPEQQRYRGVPLTPTLMGQGMRPRVFHIESSLPAPNRALGLSGIVTIGWKYLHSDPPALYNLLTDPDESTNVAKTEESQLKRLRNWFRNGQHNMQYRNAPNVELTDHDRMMLSTDSPTNGDNRQ